MTADHVTAPSSLRNATQPHESTATDAWLVRDHGLRFRDAMTHIVRACDQALADARLTTTGDLDGPLHSLVTDLRREKAAALTCRAIFESHVTAAAAEMRDVAQATDDAYMGKIADALDTDAYQELAP